MKQPFKLPGIIAAGLMVISSPASAIVTTWDYSITTLFTFATFTGGGGGPISGGTAALSWGTSTGSGQSSLAIVGSPATGQVDTYFGLTPPQELPFLGASTPLTHNNNPVGGNSLTSAILTNSVFLDPIVPDAPPLSLEFEFAISFTETPNSGTCAVTASPTPCNDIFVLNSGLLNSSFSYDDGTGLSTYFVNIFPIAGGVLSVLEDSACAAAGAAANCVGFSTPEGQSTTLAFGFTISAEPLLQIPEPGILALLGVGMMGLSAWSRRRG